MCLFVFVFSFSRSPFMVVFSISACVVSACACVLIYYIILLFLFIYYIFVLSISLSLRQSSIVKHSHSRKAGLFVCSATHCSFASVNMELQWTLMYSKVSFPSFAFVDFYLLLCFFLLCSRVLSEVVLFLSSFRSFVHSGLCSSFSLAVICSRIPLLRC
jgi:hypothetical protein